MIMNKNARITRDFCMKLANEASWQFVSTSTASGWLDKLGFIMRLNKNTGVEGSKIIFIKNFFNEYNFVKSLNLNKISIWNTGPLRIYQCQNASHMICEIDNMDPEMEFFKMTQSVLPVYLKVLYQGGLPLHAALIERKGIGVAIAAPGGTGKSTCACRIPIPWQALSDDELLIVRNKAGVYHAHPFPTWSRCKTQKPNETWNVQAHVPISAIFFLKKSQKDEVTSLSFSQSAFLIYKLSLPTFYYRTIDSIDQNECTVIKKLIFENACDIARDTPAFILEASINGKFWEAIDRALSIDTKEVCVDARTSSNTN